MAAGHPRRPGSAPGQNPSHRHAARGLSATDVPRPFRNGLRELGLVEGQNIFVEYGIGRSVEELPKLANDLFGLRVDLLLASGAPAVIPAKNATTSVPIVFVAAIDPIATGLVESLARPGGNITGLTALFTDLMGKRLEFLKEAFPSISRVGLLSHSTIPDISNTRARQGRPRNCWASSSKSCHCKAPRNSKKRFEAPKGPARFCRSMTRCSRRSGKN